MFNKKFDEQITRNVLTQEIQTFNDVNTLNTMFNYQSFDYGNMIDNGYSSINDSFSLLSTNIPSEFSDSRTLEERMQAYSIDLRKKVISFIEEGNSQLLATKLFKLNKATVK